MFAKHPGPADAEREGKAFSLSAFWGSRSGQCAAVEADILPCSSARVSWFPTRANGNPCAGDLQSAPGCRERFLISRVLLESLVFQE